MKKVTKITICLAAAITLLNTTEAQNTYPATGDIGISLANTGLKFYGGGEKIIGTSDFGIQFQTSMGTPRMKITNAGTVGIGTSTPFGMLDVNGWITNSSADPYISTNTTNKHLILSGGNAWAQTGGLICLNGSTKSFRPHSIQFYSGNAERMTIEANGNIGIGTSTPFGTFDVNGWITNSSADPYISTNTTNKHLILSGGNGWAQTGGLIYLNGSTKSYRPHSIQFYSGNAERMTIEANGNIGIGTYTPTFKLDVYNPVNLGTSLSSVSYLARFAGVSGNNSQLQIGLYRNTTGGTGWTTATTRIQAVTDATGQAYIDFNPYGGLEGLSLGTAISGDVLRIASTGTVTIGTNIITNSNYKLFVQTGILTEKVKVAVNGSGNWADYVFHKDYKLMPLTEVEQFVKANNHLPNVPSAAEMVKEGNDLGKTDAKLLEKIEELTLYMIEMKKQADLQQKEIEILKKKLQKRNK